MSAAPNCIALTAEQADLVRGPTMDGSALDPVPLLDGATWILPLVVLDDPAHAEWRDFLAALPVRETHPEDLMPDDEA